MFTPTNKLEESLMKAADEPSNRPQFYKDLLEADLFVISDSAPKGEREVRFETGEEIKVRSAKIGDKIYPAVFTSLVCLRKFISEEVGYLKIKAKDLYEIAKETGFFLNPGSEYGKEFIKEEIKSILDGSIWSPKASYALERETEVFLGEPAKYPAKIVEELKKLFKQNNAIRKAYLAQIYIPSKNEPSHPAIGIEIDESANWNSVVSQAGMATEAFKDEAELVDFIKINNGGTIPEYMIKNTKPFYEK